MPPSPRRRHVSEAERVLRHLPFTGPQILRALKATGRLPDLREGATPEEQKAARDLGRAQMNREGWYLVAFSLGDASMLRVTPTTVRAGMGGGGCLGALIREHVPMDVLAAYSYRQNPSLILRLAEGSPIPHADKFFAMLAKELKNAHHIQEFGGRWVYVLSDATVVGYTDPAYWDGDL